MTSGTFATGGLWFGGDYSPEQWDEPVWAQDDLLMRRAGVTHATVGVFSWSSLEPREGCYRFDWLDSTLDRLHANGVRAVLATPTASPPPWFGRAYPDALPVTADGVRLGHGSRDTYCAAAPAYRAAALRIADVLGRRYAGHPALAMWHVHNEYGTTCRCEHAAAGFRRWLRDRYADDLDALGAAWWTAFWSQGCADWEDVHPPRATQYLPNPGQALDFARYWSDTLLAAYTEQRDVLRGHTPDVPVTTNFMLPTWQSIDLWRWSREVDVVAVDHYPDAAGPAGRADLAFGADRARSFNAGRPWLLMEHGAGVVHTGGVIAAKDPAQTVADSLGYVARGSDAVMFFQWRAGRGGAEMHHGALVPHAGPDTAGFEATCALGGLVGRLGEVAGSTVRARVAVLWDPDTWWALEARGLPSPRMGMLDAVRETHAALWHLGVTADVAAPSGDLTGYDVVLAPSLYLLPADVAARLAGYVAGGGRLLLGPFTGVVDEHHRVHLGGHPAGLLEVTGVRVEQPRPLPDGETVLLATDDGGRLTGRLWSERLRADGAQVLARYRGGGVDGLPALTRNRHGAGTAWYLSTRLAEADLHGLLREVLAAAGVGPEVPGLPAGVEAVRRHRDGRSWLFLFHHGDDPVQVRARGTDLLTGLPVPGTLTLAPGGCAVVREQG